MSLSNFVKNCIVRGVAKTTKDPLTGEVILSSNLDSDLLSTSPARLNSPDALPGLALWLDAQQPVYTASYAAVCSTLGDQVSIWPDASGNSREPTPSATKPTYDPTGLNGYPSIQFNGNSYFSTPGFLTSDYGNAITMFAVCKSTGTHNDLRIVFGTQSPNAYVGINGSNLNCDITLSGITGWTGANPLSAKDGIIGLSIGSSSVESEIGKVFWGGLGGSLTSSSKATGGTIAFSSTSLRIGAFGTGFFWPGLVGEVLVYSRALTADEFRQVYEYLSLKWGYSALRPLVVCAGNSLTSGTGSSGGASQSISISGTNYPSRLLSALGSSYDVRTDAYPGRTTAKLISESPSYSDLMVTRSISSTNIYIAWEITNTLVNTKSRGAAISQYVRLCNDRRAAGFKVISCTMINRKGGSPYAGLDIDATAVNDYIRNNWQSFSDGLADLAADSRLSNAANTTYFDADQIHLNNTGYQVVADIIYPVVISM